MDIEAKYNKLKGILADYGSVMVAYSGGVDSTFLLKAAIDELGFDNVSACIGVSGLLSDYQYRMAVSRAGAIGARLTEVKSGVLSEDSVRANKADRCFHCKSCLFRKLLEKAKEEGFDHIICGSNVDDEDDYRPGNRAVREFGIGTPLSAAGLRKEDIRELSRRLCLETADIPASPCLASRLKYGLEINDERLGQIAKSEDFLRGMGFEEFRVRHHGDMVRIEVCEVDFERVLAGRKEIVEGIKSTGIKFVAMDLEGFRSGALNESLSEDEKRANLEQ
jgi:uncharacterized protein